MLDRPSWYSRSVGFDRAFWAAGNEIRSEEARSNRRRTLVHECPGFRLLHIASFDGIDFKSRPADQFIRLAIEVTAPADPFRIRRQPMLPRTTRLSCDDPCSTRGDQRGRRTAPSLIYAGAKYIGIA